MEELDRRKTMRYQYEEFVAHKNYASQDLKKMKPIVLDKR